MKARKNMPNEYIIREAIIADIEQTIENSGCVNHEREIIDCVRYATAADVVQVVHARWVATSPGEPEETCGNCGARSRWFYENYCPNCGAKMDGGENHAD